MVEIKSAVQFKEFFLELKPNGNKLSRDLSVSTIKSVPILVLLDNIDKLPVEIIQTLESKIVEQIENNPGIRFLTSGGQNLHFK